MKAEIKVQAPLNGEGPFLIYDEKRVHVTSQWPTPDMKHRMGDSDKAFFKGSFRNGEWALGKRISDRQW